MEAYHKYKHYRVPQLLARIQQLETEVETARVKGRPNNQQESSDEAVGSSPSSSTLLPKEGEGHKPSPWKKAARDPKSRAPKKARQFDFTKMPVRKIALRFAYDGENYAGLASQGDGIPTSSASANAFQSTNNLPTVELILWNALCATHLVDPSGGFRGAGWARSGRTDRGVSAAGQVVSFWIRSSKVDERDLKRQEEERAQQKHKDGELIYVVGKDDETLQVPVAVDGEQVDHEGEEASDVVTEQDVGAAPNAAEPMTEVHDPWSNSPLQPGMSRDDKELDYVVAINRLLPPSIRVLGWSPVRPSFNARYHTRYRHYKYFFTSGPPQFTLPPETHPSHRTVPPRLNIQDMREAASYLLGEHDFRNFCKVDPSKQITNFRRRIDGVSIDRVESGWSRRQSGQDNGPSEQVLSAPNEDSEDMYVFNLRGTAFLYHQVRNIMAILFHVGSGLEKPSIVKELLNVHPGAWDFDKQWLLNAGVKRFGQVKLPKGTATELDGVTAADAEEEAFESQMSEMAISTGSQVVPTDTVEGEGPLISEMDDSNLAVYERKPEYVMAIDRPLVLWECGYRPKDISWRSGCYDGIIDQETKDAPTYKGNRDLMTGSTRVNETMYETWSQSAISTEIWRHFLLAAGVPLNRGSTGSGTLYEDSRWPFHLLPPSAPSSNSTSMSDEQDLANCKRLTQTYGHGTTRPLNTWKGLINAKMQSTPDVKNQKYMETKALGKAKRLEEKAKREAESKQSEETAQVAKGDSAV
ncbi:unnamed protein product [Sympodiomycopsis kandeliae]